MARRGLFIILAVLSLAGCDQSYADRNPTRVFTDAQTAALRADVDAIGERCRAERVSGQLIGFAGSVQCSNPAIASAYERAGFPYISLLDLGLAERLQLAERVDAKKISEGDMLVQFYSDVRGLPAIPPP